MSKLNEVIIEQLLKWKVNRIYSYPGDTILDFLAAVKESPLELYTTKHESTAGLMASAESKLSDQLAVCAAHGGPGTANIINGIADAYSDKTPLLLLSGQAATKNIDTSYKQMVGQLELTNPLTVYSALVTNPKSIVDLLVKAMTTALTKGGVSHLAIPMDLWQAETNAQPRDYPTHLEQKIVPEDKVITAAAEEINRAQKPIILYGRGAKDCATEITKLTEQTNAGLIHSLPAKGIIDGKQTNLLGGLGSAGNTKSSELLKAADLIIILGSTWWPMDYTPRQPRVVQLDSVKENIGATHPVDVGVMGDLKLSLDKLLSQIEKKNNSAWARRINEAHQEWLEQLNEKIEKIAEPLSPQSIINSISEQISDDEIICLDSGDNVVWFGKNFSDQCADILTSGTWRTMGFALPAALSAKINRPQQPVTAIIGDGGLNMVLAELATAVKYNLPIRVIVLNNESLAMEKNKMKVADLPLAEVELSNPDFAQIAQACGAKGVEIESLDHLQNILTESKETSEPILLNVPTTAPIPSGTKLH
ncbi:thiamine pyrophosphate-binding protein [Fuchsiella alkaliacetigena]|uniref:thiamine pyrophosphate-binding protein n=1 Tax=Fuchsiella alkaliacetigena TaxID=957042 RepID=UPI002009DE5B|nr:thiamine pyrophosphate-binding protein [Fuchsiella alkaliacetigena]MCK8824661.1 thiamine pyrophosphate-binding protein [Fuchsiella alkaliacetigena]